jgi:hypothetical protein
MKASQIANKAAEKLPESAVNYTEVDLSEEDFLPDRPFRGIYIGGEGDLVISSAVAGGGSAKFTGIQPGFYPLSGRSIKKTGTTATNIVALF